MTNPFLNQLPKDEVLEFSPVSMSIVNGDYVFAYAAIASNGLMVVKDAVKIIYEEDYETGETYVNQVFLNAYSDDKIMIMERHLILSIGTLNDESLAEYKKNLKLLKEYRKKRKQKTKSDDAPNTGNVLRFDRS